MLRTTKYLLIFAIVPFVEVSLAFDKDVDPCARDVYESLESIPLMTRRFVGYSLQDKEIPICDVYLTETWYKMPNFSIVSTNASCGTSMSWYMKDSLPTENEVKTITVCRRDGTACTKSNTIQVKRCSMNDYVFYLVKPKSCPEAYCIESLTGVKLDQMTAPNISEINPVVNVSIKKTDFLGEHEYFCEFEPTDMTLLYKVSWGLTTGISIVKELKSTDFIKYTDNAFRYKSKLTETDLNNTGIRTIGYTVMCSVVARKIINGRLSAIQNSKPNYFGIKVLTKETIYLDSKNKENITIELTVPFACTKGDANKCYVRVQLSIPTSGHCMVPGVAQQTDTNGCGINIYNAQLNKPQNITLSTKHADSNTKMPPQLHEVRFKTQALSSHEMMGGFVLDPVKVITTGTSTALSGKKCHAHSDPHMMTFDGEKYDYQHEGKYIMYKNEKYNTQVQIWTHECFFYVPVNKPYCVKATAIQAGRDVFHVDLIKNEIRFKNCEDRVLKGKVVRKGDVFKIYLPTGTDIIISPSPNSEYLEVDIYPSLFDQNNSKGLCGNFDGDDANDGCMSSTDRECWIVPKDDDLFNEDNYPSLKPWKEDDYLCTCNRPSADAIMSGLLPAAECDAANKKVCTEPGVTSINSDMCTLGRRKRDTHVSSETSFDGQYTEMPRVHIFNKREDVLHLTPYNETTARQECIRRMNTASVNMCKVLPGLNISTYVDNCVADAVISSSMDWGQVHIEAIKRHCIKHVALHQPIPPEVLAELAVPTPENENATEDTNSTAVTTVSPTTEVPNPFQNFTAELLSEIIDVSCPNDCSGKGICTEGKCTCNDGLLGEDCSIDAELPPKITGIPDKGKCDISQRDCAVTSVIGRKFVDSVNLTCRLRQFTVNGLNQLTILDSMTVRGHLESFLEVYCKLPPNRHKRSTNSSKDYIARGYRVSVSNNGQQFSPEDSIVIFDSTCVDCNKTNATITCATKMGYCMNDGRCYKEGDRLGCYTCLRSSLNPAEWTPGKECGQPMPEPPAEPGKLWIIGATVGPMLLLTFVSVIVICFCSKKGGKAKSKIVPVSPLNEPRKSDTP